MEIRKYNIRRIIYCT